MELYNRAVEQHRQLILDSLDFLWRNPEAGYREWKTHAFLKNTFEQLGYTVTEAGDIPGFTAVADTGRPGPTVLVFGEMDGLIIPAHPECDPETGAVHACGHCAQAAALVGIAAALKEPGVMDRMCGKVLLCAVPAEELIDVEWRMQLRKDGKIRYLGGKPEFLARGLLDEADLAFMVHTTPEDKPHGSSCVAGSNGLLVKSVTFEGVSAHAGGSPHKGINALYAANLALNAINALRETFRDEDHIRVHPIITGGGSSVNAIPDKVTLESYVRGADMTAIAEANRKINRAIAASAAAMGATATISDLSGYWPRVNTADYAQLFGEAAEQAGMSYEYRPGSWSTGCSDMGDISSLMPAIHPNCNGASGTSHGTEYRISDPETACVDSAKMQLQALGLLLEQDGVRAKQIVADYKPFFRSKEEYFEYTENLAMNKQTVVIDGSGKIVLDFQN